MKKEITREKGNAIYPQDYYYEEFKSSQNYILKGNIPIEFLNGRQRIDEYDRKKTQGIKDELRRKGKAFLEENPIIVIYDGIRFIIYDGHHRTRFAPIFGIKEIPSIIFPLSAFKKIESKNISELKRIFEQDVSEASASFKRETTLENGEHANGISLPKNHGGIEGIKVKFGLIERDKGVVKKVQTIIKN